MAKSDREFNEQGDHMTTCVWCDEEVDERICVVAHPWVDIHGDLCPKCKAEVQS